MDMKFELTGYCHSNYALSFSQLGKPRKLPACGGWVIERNIPGTTHSDCMGCYPLFSCKDWGKIHEDLIEIRSEMVSLTLVTDPFAPFDKAYLEKIFNIVKPYKNHFVADLHQDLNSFVNKKHRQKARSALSIMQMEFCNEPLKYLNEWIVLYQNLVKRHSIIGIRAFSNESFHRQLETDGMNIALCRICDEIIAAMLFIVDGDVAYTHLSAFSDKAYNVNASFGLYWGVLNYLKELNVKFVDIGAGSGISQSETDGLIRFKTGWSNTNRMVYLCGCILDGEKYAEVCRLKSIEGNNYFPSYRVGEFT